MAVQWSRPPRSQGRSLKSSWCFGSRRRYGVCCRLPGALICRDLTAFGFKSQNLHDLRLPVAGNIIWLVIPCDSSYDKYIFCIYDYI
ncbi:unnamed protein product [Cladocopium goreaui]|uniref:Uncharacterized protein n=1 Tax=Cladocopium goreaui TaxID=2562237 RepID=A0A9P1GK55_9DINO|nr:unnamed protein product [Cladocopium goreaui]